ncbi:MAG TPA: glycosyltransferase family 2 protein [Patescibacteria group bacterium]|nr:glycosyltransferase family 2 protein [Patescibacteria group bacterium]
MTPVPPIHGNRLPERPLVVISILNWNGWRDTIACLESVYAQDYPNFLTVVVDNGSWNGSAERIRRWAIRRLGKEAAVVEYDRWTALAGGRSEDEARLDGSEPGSRLVLIRSRENLGWAGGNNMVRAYSLRRRSVRFVFFLNNDAVLGAGSLTKLVDVGACLRKVVLAPVEQTPGADGALDHLSLPRFLFAPLVSPGRPGRDTGPLRESEVVSGAAMLVSRAVLEDFLCSEGECFSSKIFLYWEDHLFCHLAGRRGSVVGYVRDAAVWHKGSASSGGALSPLLFYYRERGKIFAANAALPLGLRALFHVVNPWLCVARAAKYALASPDCAQAALCGFADGLRGVGGKWRDHDRFAGLSFQSPPLLAEENER